MTLLKGKNMYDPAKFSYSKIHNEDNYEVLLTLRNRPRRFAVCSNEIDALTCVKAMQLYANSNGQFMIPNYNAEVVMK